MAAKVVKVDTDTLRRWLEMAEGDQGELAGDVRAVLAPLFAKPQAPKKRPAVSAMDFVSLGREILGERFVTPERLSSGWIGKVTTMLRNGGVSGTMEAVELLEHCATWVRGPILADTIAAKSGSWLALARARNRPTTTGDDRVRAPMELEV